MELNDRLTIDVDMEEDSDDKETNECTICFEDLEGKKCITDCDHIYCEKCLHAWFNKKKNTCPTCREEIKYYTKNKEKNHIVKIKTEETINEINIIHANEILIEHLKQRIHRLNIFFAVNVLYLCYNVFNDYQNKLQLYLYKENYENCSQTLNHIENNLSETFIYYNHELIKCVLPDYYLEECISN